MPQVREHKHFFRIPTPGSLGSWLGVDRGLPILTLELPPGPLAGFARQAAAALDTAVRPRVRL